MAEIKKREIQSKGRYLAAFLIGTGIFIFGFFLTFMISYFEFERISEFQDVTSYDIFYDRLSYSIFNEDICSKGSLKDVSRGLNFQGRIIDDLEKKFGKDNMEVLFRKKFYSLVELEHYDFVNQINLKCGNNISTILFFYSTNNFFNDYFYF